MALVRLSFVAYSAIFPNARARTAQDHAVFSESAYAFEIDTAPRLSAYCAQLYHESNGLSVLVENLNYTASALMRVWPSRFKTRAAAVECQRKGPQGIANVVYANRMGNGGEVSGDGWRYRGRGYIQLTGRRGYREMGRKIGMALEDSPDLAMLHENASVIAATYWSEAGCNELADTGNIIGVTRAINGGLNGLTERIALTTRFAGLVSLA